MSPTLDELLGGAAESAAGAPGRVSVDASCIGCDLCPEIAPALFRTAIDTGAAYVWRQPSTPAEVQLCIEAMDTCPVDAIHDDGEEP
jgi:ferredoxin